MSTTTSLRNAIKNDHYDACLLLLEYGALINDDVDTNTTHNYASPLCIAVEYNRLEICRLLMDHGADVYGINGIDLRSIYHVYNIAAEYGYMDICELLLRGELRNDKDYSCVLCYAVHRECNSLAKRLIRHGTDIKKCLTYESDEYEDFANMFINLLADVLNEYRLSNHSNNDTEHEQQDINNTR